MLKFSTNVFLKDIAFVRENEPSFGIFENNLFIEMEPSKLNNYSTETWQTCYSTMVIKLQSILSPDFYHGVVGHGEWCGAFFEDETKKKQKENGRIQTYKLVMWSDQTRPDQQPHHQTTVARLVSIEDPWAEGHHSVEFFVWPHHPQSCYKAWEGATLQTQKRVQKWVALHEEDISRFLADYRLLLCTAWNTTNFRHYHHYYQCACCTRTDCSTHGLT